MINIINNPVSLHRIGTLTLLLTGKSFGLFAVIRFTLVFSCTL